MIIYTTKTKETPENLEGESLAAHVAMCRQREVTMQKRLDDIETKQTKIETREEELRTYILRTITTVAISLVSSALSFGMMLSEFIRK